MTDPNGLPYSFGTLTPSLIFSGGTPKLGSSPYLIPTQAVGLDINGKFILTLADTSILTPPGSKWNFIVCSGAGTIQPAFGKGNICFTLVVPITISGSSVDISSQLNAVALALTVPFGSPSINYVLITNKPIKDVREYFVVGNGSTDDTANFQNAINAACGSNAGSSAGSTLIIPQGFNIKITATVTINQCGGFVLDGLSGTGPAGFGAQITWAGSAGGTMLAINRTRDSVLQNFTLNCGNCNVPLDIDENAGSGITSHNLFSRIALSGSGTNASWVGIRIGLHAPGNVEQQVFRDMTIVCPTNGTGIDFAAGTNVQPFYTSVQNIQLTNCAPGFFVHNSVDEIIIDGGLSNSSNPLLKYFGGQNVVIRNIREENLIAVPVIKVDNSGGTGGQLTIDHMNFQGLTSGQTVIDMSAATSATQLFLTHNLFQNIAGVTAISPNTGGSAFTFMYGNTWPNSTCVDATSFGGQVVSIANVPVGGRCINQFTNVSVQPPLAQIGNQVTCSASTEGSLVVATNCNAACSAGGTCTAGGTTHCQLYCNGSAYFETGR